MAFVGRFAAHSAPAVWFIAGGNLAWIMASLWLLVGGAFAPNALGGAFVAAQAAVVAGLTLQRSAAPSRCGAFPLPTPFERRPPGVDQSGCQASTLNSSARMPPCTRDRVIRSLQ